MKVAITEAMCLTPGPQRDRLQERFEASVVPEPNTGCWLWEGAVRKSGHPKIKAFGRSLGAHRVALLLQGTALPPGFHAARQCRNRACVNPDHILPLSAEDNGRLSGGRLRTGRLRTGRRGSVVREKGNSEPAPPKRSCTWCGMESKGAYCTGTCKSRAQNWRARPGKIGMLPSEEVDAILELRAARRRVEAALRELRVGLGLDVPVPQDAPSGHVPAWSGYSSLEGRWS